MKERKPQVGVTTDTSPELDESAEDAELLREYEAELARMPPRQRALKKLQDLENALLIAREIRADVEKQFRDVQGVAEGGADRKAMCDRLVAAAEYALAEYKIQNETILREERSR